MKNYFEEIVVSKMRSLTGVTWHNATILKSKFTNDHKFFKTSDASFMTWNKLLVKICSDLRNELIFPSFDIVNINRYQSLEEVVNSLCTQYENMHTLTFTFNEECDFDIILKKIQQVTEVEICERPYKDHKSSSMRRMCVARSNKMRRIDFVREIVEILPAEITQI